MVFFSVLKKLWKKRKVFNIVKKVWKNGKVFSTLKKLLKSEKVFSIVKKLWSDHMYVVGLQHFPGAVAPFQFVKLGTHLCRECVKIAKIVILDRAFKPGKAFF